MFSSLELQNELKKYVGSTAGIKYKLVKSVVVFFTC